MGRVGNSVVDSSTPGAATRLWVLTLLSDGPKHGYELRRYVEERRLSEWADVPAATIYSALHRMAVEGLIERGAQSQAGKRPPRTPFHITAKGRDALRVLLEEAWSSPPP